MERVDALHAAAFDRTGARPPQLDFRAIQRDATEGGESLLAGVYWGTREAPDDLVSFIWGRLHGDYASYDVGATERADDLRNLPLAYPLILTLADWARRRGATWLDLGGVERPGVEADTRLQGITQFKRRFTKDEREVGIEFAMEPSPVLAGAGRAARKFRNLLSR
jgi:hypothetical protein